MQIPIKQLPPPVLVRLQAIQQNPAANDCFYSPQAGKGGAIFGLVVAALGLLGLLLWAFAAEMPLAVGLIAGLLLGAWLWGSIGRIRRLSRSPLRPAVVINPLYFIRITADDVSFNGLWSELRDLKITHHHTNGVYTFTNFEFFFKRGTKQAVAVRPKAMAEQLAARISDYQRRMVAAAEAQNVEEIAAYDVFAEARLPDATGQPPRFKSGKRDKRKRLIMTWAVGGATGMVVGFALFALSYVNAQARYIEHMCYYSPRSCEGYFEAFAVPVYTSRAQRALTDVYKRQWEREKVKVPKLREMMKLERVEHVTPAQEKEILALYHDGSRKELRALYQKAIDKYKKVSTGANNQARDAMIRMLELARDKGYYRVKVVYAGITEKVKGDLKLPPAARGKTVVPMGPSFTPTLNKSRESLITDRIHRAFMAIVPQDVLEFPGLKDRYRSRYGSSSYRSRYGSLSRRLERLRARTRAAIDKNSGKAGEETADEKAAELLFKVGYVVFPSTSIYVSRKNPGRAYMGIGFDWLVKMVVKDETVYTLRQRSYPPPRFTVRSYGGRYAPKTLGAGTVYAKMATTAFDNFSKQITTHFGIPVKERPRYRNTGRYGRRSGLGHGRGRYRSGARGRLTSTR